MSARLHNFYKEKVAADLMQKFGYKSVMEVPRITKITLNMGLVKLLTIKKLLSTRLAI
jgi:large subunit ribosomal protein L5